MIISNKIKYFFRLRRNNWGSMLMNLLVSIGIMALLLTISMPALRQYQPNLQLSSAIRDLTTDLRLAQQLTVTEQNMHVLTINDLTGTYQIIKYEPATTTIKTVTLPVSINFQAITGFTDNEIRYNAYGGVIEEGQIILINTNNNTKTINIKPSGYVQGE